MSKNPTPDDDFDPSHPTTTTTTNDPPDDDHNPLSGLSTSPLEPLFGGSDDMTPPDASTAFCTHDKSSSDPKTAVHNKCNNNNNRSRHCSANSSQSCVSFDSAIGDVYSPIMSASSTFEFDPDLLSEKPHSTVANNNNVGCRRSSPVSSPASSSFVARRNPPKMMPATTHHQGRQQTLSWRPYQPHHQFPPYQRQEVEMVCLDLLRRFQHASSQHPRQMARAWISRSEDPLLITTRLLQDALTRLKLFLFGLEPMAWLAWPDQVRWKESAKAMIYFIFTSNLST